MAPRVSAVLIYLALTITLPWANAAEQVAKLTPGTSAWSIGSSIAVDGDTMLLTSAQFVHVLTGWREQARLDVPGMRESSSLSLALQDDTAFVGVPEHGTVHVYTRSGTRWSRTALLQVPEVGRFGSGVAIDGNTILVGSSGTPNPEGVPFGAAYVFTRGSGSWHQQGRLTAPRGLGLDLINFGHYVDIEGDTAVVSGNEWRTNRAWAFVFTRRGGVWSREAAIVVPYARFTDNFGFSVAIAGDTIALGDMDLGQGERIVLFRRSGSRWIESGRLVGDELTIDGDVLLTTYRRHGITRSGVGYVYRRSGVQWRLDTILKAKDRRRRTSFGSPFGSPLALDGDTAVLAQPRRSGIGAVYVFRLAPRSQLHCPGDLDADGSADLALVTGRDVQVKSFDGRLISRFPLDAAGELIDSEVMMDINGNGSPELVALNAPPAGAEVRDLLNGALLGRVDFSDEFEHIDLEIVPDQSGNGIPELASVAERIRFRHDVPATITVRDVMSGQTTSESALVTYLLPVGHAGPAPGRRGAQGDRQGRGDGRTLSSGSLLRPVSEDSSTASEPRRLQEVDGSKGHGGTAHVSSAQPHDRGSS